MDLIGIIKGHWPEGGEASEKTIKALAKEIGAAVGAAFVPKESYSKKTERINELESELQRVEATLSDEKTAHEKTQEFYTTQMDTAETNALMRKALEADGANPKAIDLLLKAIDPKAIVKANGVIENWEDVSKPVRRQYGDFFGEILQKAVETAAPPTGGPAGNDPFLSGLKK